MKKMLKWALPALLGVVPVMGAEEAGIIKDSFFEKATCSIRMVVESGNTVKAFVDATSTTGTTQSKLVDAMCAPLGYHHDDVERVSQEKVKAQVICGSQYLEKGYVKALKTPYTLKEPTTVVNLFAGQTLADADLPLGEIAESCVKTVYERKDGTLFEDKSTPEKIMAALVYNGQKVEKNEIFDTLPLNEPVNVMKVSVQESGEELSGPVIYQIILKQRDEISTLYRCYEHKDEVCNQGFKVTKKFRHWWETGQKTDSLTEAFKLSNGQETLLPTLTQRTPVSIRVTSRDSGRTNHPDCPGQSWPAGYQIIGL